MAYLSLYRKYRPQTFKDILGQEHVSATLANAITEDRVAHAYLFTGPRGTGKTSTARILAKALNCELGPTPDPCGKCASCVAIAEGSSLDVIEMDAASHSKVEETREILTGVALATAGGRRKVYVIDEVHMLTTQSFNALLKTLEEPPEHVVFVLATTEAHKVLPTIVSRTQRFDFRRVSADTIEAHLAEVAKLENIDADPAAIALVARHADGSVRDALSALDQFGSIGDRVSFEDAERMLGHRREEAFFELFDAIAGGDVGRVLTTIQSLVSQGADLRRLASGVLGHARSLVLLKSAPDAGELLDVAAEDRPRLVEQSETFTGGGLLRILDLVSGAITEMRNAPEHRLLLEVALIRAASPDTDPSATGLLGRIERLERRIGIETAGVVAGPEPTAPRPEPAVARPPRRPNAAAASPPAPPAQSSEAEGAPALPPAAEEPPDTPPPAQRTEEARPTPAAGIGIDHVDDAWPATLAAVTRASKRVGAYLNPSRPLRFDGDTLVVEVRSPFHAEAMGEPNNMTKLAGALDEALGIKPPIVFVGQGGDAPATPQPADDDAIDLADTTEAEATDPVELVKKGLHAEIVQEMGE